MSSTLIKMNCDVASNAVQIKILKIRYVFMWMCVVCVCVCVCVCVSLSVESWLKSQSNY